MLVYPLVTYGLMLAWHVEDTQQNWCLAAGHLLLALQPLCMTWELLLAQCCMPTPLGCFSALHILQVTCYPAAASQAMDIPAGCSLLPLHVLLGDTPFALYCLAACWVDVRQPVICKPCSSCKQRLRDVRRPATPACTGILHQVGDAGLSQAQAAAVRRVQSGRVGAAPVHSPALCCRRRGARAKSSLHWMMSSSCCSSSRGHELQVGLVSSSVRICSGLGCCP